MLALELRVRLVIMAFFIKPRQTGKKIEFLALNSCSFLNTDPIFTK